MELSTTRKQLLFIKDFTQKTSKNLIFDKNRKTMLKAGVLGAGHLGKIHLRLLINLINMTLLVSMTQTKLMVKK